MRVVGTAGHVDHGKSTLVNALTGINPDRLKEEQAREMTIDLGFAWFTLPDGEQVGVVDVPGHRDFIENMLAGVGGIDAVLFVVAADEGVMPQTREHLQILDLLQIHRGIVVLTKADLVEDEEWFDLVEADVRAALRGTVLVNAPFVRVSARSGQGIAELKQRLAELLADSPVRPDLGRPRLPVDRVFTIAGFGTVVTGTLQDGSLRLGEEVEILPGGPRARIRTLQAHKQKENLAVPGSRTAVNLSGVDVEDVRRGQVLTLPGSYRPSQRLDVHFRLLPDASTVLRHSSEVKFFIGAAEVVARVRLLGMDELQPGEEGWLQLELSAPVVAVRGDRYILRRPSPGETLGGGMVIDPQPARRHKRFNPALLAQLDALRQGSPGDVLLQAGLAAGPASMREVALRSRLSPEQLAAALQELVEGDLWVQLEGGALRPEADLLVAPRALWEAETRRAIAEMEQYHLTYPVRRGMPREELKSRLKATPRLFNAAMRWWLAQGVLVEAGKTVALPRHTVVFTAAQTAQVGRLLEKFAAAPYTPPGVKECQAEVGEEVYNALLDSRRLVQVSPEVVFRSEEAEAMTAGVERHLQNAATLTLAEFRDHFQTSRKYAQAFLEYLDANGLTQRSGDARTLRKARAKMA